MKRLGDPIVVASVLVSIAGSLMSFYLSALLKVAGGLVTLLIAATFGAVIVLCIVGMERS